MSVPWIKANSVQLSRSVVSDSLRPHESQHARPPCPSQTRGVYSDSCPSGWWCHPAISSSVVSFSSCPQSLPASGSFQMSQLFTWGGQSIGVLASASVLPMNTQDWSPSGWTGWISLQFKGISRVFSNTTVQKHQFFSAQLSSQSNSHIHTWPLEKPRQTGSGQTRDGKSECWHFRNQRTKMDWNGWFNSDDHYIYYCGQKSLRRKKAAIIVNKRVWNAVLGCNLKNDRMTSVCFQGKPFNITIIQVYALTSNVEEAEVEWFYEDLQDLLELTAKKDVLFIIGDRNAKLGS